MQLFGCMFCDPITGLCDRKNFDSLLWATVTVFQVIICNLNLNVAMKYSPQILTQEDWNIVLFAGMERTTHWAALYFVLLMTFGNYVLFNLLVAILVEGFSKQDELFDNNEVHHFSELLHNWFIFVLFCYSGTKSGINTAIY